MDPGIGAADGGADGDGNNIRQLVASGARIASTKPLPIASGYLKYEVTGKSDLRNGDYANQNGYQ